MDDLAADVGQTVAAAPVAEGESCAVEAHQVQDRRVEVLDVDAVLHDLQAVLVGFALDDAGLHAGAGQPGAEGPVVVLAGSIRILLLGMGWLIERSFGLAFMPV